ncbi:P-glyco protein [Glomus cerebriforme]|uniref:p-glyco protein n=1 Tax=Glomus cerebriforme TaxID=658196 RepID=A0A397T387_9GLOM|nr:P-glyco protein [Glomus cerebriforme]
MFRFATPLDKFYMIVGTIAAIANGASIPFMTIIFSGFIDIFARFSLAVSIHNSTGDEGKFDVAKKALETDIRTYVYYFLILGASMFLASYIQMTFWTIAGENQAKRVRKLYYSSILKQEIAYFDNMSTGDITTRISNDTNLYQEGISDKIGLIIQNFSTLFGGFIIAFIKSWKLTLVLCSLFPALILSGALMAKSVSGGSSEGQDAYAAAGGIAEQVLSNIRTVIAFGGQSRELARYTLKLELAYKAGRKKAIASGLGIGAMMMFLFFSYALAFWYGSKLILSKEKTGGEILNAFFAITIGAFSIGNTSPYFGDLAKASGSAKHLFTAIDRKSLIDVTSTTGKSLPPSKLEGQIEFKNVSFSYPSRPDVQVLKNFTLKIEHNKTVALVGSSGSGKSTIIGLLERFYDPNEGEILIDGIPIKEWNLKTLRGFIGLVGQEPILFQNTIKQNIAWGKISEEDKEISLKEIEEVCKKSNAYDFINELPKTYDTLVGEKGALLSGGQKQRIAIARALIKDPPILLLDEATSALDTESERLVQDALDNASSNRTTIVIAHRLSTIKNADKIVVMHNGEIKEVGKHDELIAKKGVYYGLVQAQELKTHKEHRNNDEEEDDDDSDSIDSTTNTEEVIISFDEKDKSTQLRKILTKDSIKSLKEEEERILKEKEEKYKQTKAPFSRLFKLNKPELLFIIVGVIASAINGTIFPLFALVFSAILDTFAKVDHPDELRKGANFLSGMFVVIGITIFLAEFFKNASFMLSSERLTKRIRIMTFNQLMKQEVAFFDDEDNGTGILTAKLAVDATKIEGLTGSLMGNIIQTVTTVALGMGLAFAYGWKLTLVVVAAAPVIGIANYAKLRSLTGYGSKTRKAYEGTGQIVHQSVSNIRTIASLSLEDTFYKIYDKSISEPHKIAIRGTIIASAGFGISQAMMFFFYALAFWYGSQLVKNQEYSVVKMFNVLFAIAFSASSLGQISTFSPNVSKAKIAALSIFEILDRKPNTSPPDSINDRPTPVTGSSKFTDVHFSYPARPTTQILRGLSMSVLANKTVALVGSSGSGKSTVISLLLRYYNANSGIIHMENVDIQQWDLEYLRENMSLVGQEPILFDLTIGENIAYGKEGTTQEEIELAAKQANIHHFIDSLPDKYDTRVGEKGTQLSGGQKQRVAIARALIRRPKLLLLDEATSALDSESEKVVQNALDKAAKGRTTLTIAHRLSTIQNSDLILVCKKGKIIESGNHLELISKKGLYFDLVNRQILMKK